MSIVGDFFDMFAVYVDPIDRGVNQVAKPGLVVRVVAAGQVLSLLAMPPRGVGTIHRAPAALGRVDCVRISGIESNNKKKGICRGRKK